MRFFTAAWASGNQDGAESETVVQRYNDYLATLDRNGAVYRFATTVSLNDAYLDRLVVDAATERVELLLLTGDNQVGYWRTTLSYASAHVAGGQGDLARALALRPSEIWYDEFAKANEGMSHSFLLAPRNTPLRSAGEFQIDFKAFSFTQVRADGRRLATPEDESVWR